MSNLDENMEWKDEFDYLSSLPKTNPYRVPENYFRSLTERIESQVFLSELEPVENAFSTPVGYFDELTEQIKTKVELAQISSAVEPTGFTVPAHYFEGLNEAILAKTVNRTAKPKIVQLWQHRIFKYATAACLLLITASGVYYNSYRSEQLRLASAEQATEHMLFDIDESLIREHIQETSNETNTSDAEIENYILTNFSSSDITNNM